MKQEASEQTALRLREQARRAERQDRPVCGRFVAGEERIMALRAASENGVAVDFDGGWPEAERVQVCFHPYGMAPEYTHLWLEAIWNARFGSPTHRDLLGSLMALGYDRSLLGDLVVQEGKADLCVLPEILPLLMDGWCEAGHTALRVRPLEDVPDIEPPRGALRRDTVASLRLDSVLASGMNLSRARAAELIRAGNVQVAHVPEERADRLLHEGDLLSVRGFGRVRLLAVGEETRKGRLPVTLEVFNRQA